MTSVLLDTHAFVWAVTNPERLGPQAQTLVEDPTNDLFVSAATAWELATKVRLGKFAEAEPLVAQYPSIVQQLGAADLPITAEHARRAGGLEWDHRDPFDRMLAAQAMLDHTILVSRDGAFSQLAGLDLRW